MRAYEKIASGPQHGERLVRPHGGQQTERQPAVQLVGLHEALLPLRELVQLLLQELVLPLVLLLVWLWLLVQSL